ncbi:MAG: hypothetical protein EB075_04030 [Bacteroidetes bacterium]|nr:hypothetical protein [Bacteroidota bacterium]
MFRALVKGWRRLSASVEAPKVAVADVKLQKVAAPQVTRLEVRAALALRQLATLIGYTAPAAQTSWLALSATDIEFLIGSLNRYLKETVGVSDLPTLDLDKPLADNIGLLSDAINSFAIQKAHSENIGVVEQISILLNIFRRFVDTVSFAESQVIDIGKSRADTARIFEEATLLTGKGLADSATMVEDHALAYGSLLDDAFGFAQDTHEFSVGKPLLDNALLLEERAFDLSKPRSDSFSMGDAKALLIAPAVSDDFPMSDSLEVQFSRSPVDPVTFADGSVWDVEKGLSDQPILTEGLSYDARNTLSDSLVMGDQDVLSIVLPKADTTSVSESLARTVTYNRAFADAFGLDDLISVAEHHVETKQNIFSFTEDQVFGVGKSLQDAPSVTESLALHIFEGANAMGGSVLNAAPLN